MEPKRDCRWENRAPAVPANVSPMRNAVVAFAADHGAGSRAQTDLALAVSEALTNAVMHAFTSQAPGTMRVVARAALGVLHVSIIDDGGGMSPREDSPGLGVGLTVIDRITTSVEVRHGPTGGGTEMRLTFAVPGLQEAA